MEIMNMLAIIISLLALAICVLVAITGLFKDGFKGLKEKRKPIFISFVGYVVFFLVFILTQ